MISETAYNLTWMIELNLDLYLVDAGYVQQVLIQCNTRMSDSELVQSWYWLQQSKYGYDTLKDQIALFGKISLHISRNLTVYWNTYHTIHTRQPKNNTA